MIRNLSNSTLMIISLATLIDRYTREERICPSRKLVQVIDDYILQ